MTIKKTAKWMRKLTQQDLRHLAETNSTGRPNLAALKANMAAHRANGTACHDCNRIVRRMGGDPATF